MSRHSRQFEPGEVSLNRCCIGMTDAASFNPDLSLSFAGLGCRSFKQPEGHPALRLRLLCMFLPLWSLSYAECFSRCSSLTAISGPLVSAVETRPCRGRCCRILSKCRSLGGKWNAGCPLKVAKRVNLFNAGASGRSNAQTVRWELRRALL